LAAFITFRTDPPTLPSRRANHIFEHRKPITPASHKPPEPEIQAHADLVVAKTELPKVSTNDSTTSHDKVLEYFQVLKKFEKLENPREEPMNTFTWKSTPSLLPLSAEKSGEEPVTTFRSEPTPLKFGP
jgi:hypothetical protein